MPTARKESARHRQYRMIREDKMILLQDLIRAGCSFPEADQYAGLPVGTCSTWADRYANFDQATTRAQEDFQRSQRHTWRRLADQSCRRRD